MTLSPSSCRPTTRPRGYTLVELIVVMTVAGILTTAAVPSFRRTLERAKADQAAASLRAIWSAQQLFWLENQTYATSLPQLESLGLVDPSILQSGGDYTYSLGSASAIAFTIRATRQANGASTGSLSIDQSGIVTGTIRVPGGISITPSFK